MLVSLSMDTCMYVSMCVWLYACNITECNVCKFWYVIKSSGMLWYVVVCCGTPGPTVVSHPARVVTFNRRFLQLLSLGGMEKYIRQNFLRLYKIERMGLTFELCLGATGRHWWPTTLKKKSHRIARIVGWDEPLAPTREWSICALPTAYIYLTFPWLFFFEKQNLYIV